VAFNNRAWVSDTSHANLLTRRELSASIEAVEVSDTAAAFLAAGQVSLMCSTGKAVHVPRLRTHERERRRPPLQHAHPCLVVTLTPNLSETRFVLVDIQPDPLDGAHVLFDTTACPRPTDRPGTFENFNER
jgi:hypothetical protein